jgi:hypothetical protein
MAIMANDCAGKGGQIAEFAGAERETRIARLPSRKQVGQGGDPERGSMGRHVPAIGEQRHRSGEPSHRDFTDIITVVSPTTNQARRSC